MKKLHDVTKLKAWNELESLGFKRIKFTFQGLAYSYGAEAKFKTYNGNELVIQLKYWNGASKYSSGLDIRFRDYNWSKSCRFYLNGKKLTKELDILIHKIKYSENFTKNLIEINY